MAFKNGLSERLDELRFPSPRSPPSESAFPGYNALSPGHSNFGSAFSRPSHDVRANLQRRFTTDSSKLSSSWNYLNQGASPMHDPVDLLSSFEKKRQHIEYMREQKRRFEEDMKMLDKQHEKEKIEMDQLARDLAKAGLQGPVSEPTTPPEHQDTSVSATVTRPGRFSSSSVTSAPGFFNAFAPSSTLTSPQATSQGQQSAQSTAQPTDHFAGHSLPGSRRNSEKEDFIPEPASTLRTGTSVHRYSVPSGNYNASRRPQTQGFNVGPAIDSFAAAKHLFHDDENASPKDVDRMSTPDIKGIISMTEPDDKFPTLSRRTGSNILSANPDAHDLASRRTPGPQSHSFHTRHRSTHQSMPQNVGEMRLDQVNSAAKNDHGDMAKARELLRRSLEATFVLPDRDAEAMTPVPANRPAAVQSSYSTNDLPTVSHSGHNSISHSGHNSITSPQSQAEHLHSHNPSIGSISTSAASRPASMESSGFDALSNIQSTQTPLQGSVASYGPYPTSVAAPPYTTSVAAPAGNLTAATTLPFPVPIYPYSFAVQPFTGQPVHTVTNNQLPSFPAANTYGDYNYGSGYRFNENRYNENRYNGNRHNENRHNENRYNENRYSDHRYNENPGRSNVGQRRHTHTEGDVIHPTRYANYPVAHYRGDLYTMCKDQHGCRYLQRKLEERDPEDVQMIFSETYMHVIELMTDPFGNYLCQKLFEYATTEQRTVLVNHAAPQLVPIALNQHGTRALQKMIEFITTPEQTWTVIRALDGHVVDLVQDLNGNHVIQKCLNSFHDGDADFILEAVGSNCVRVGTHRHGCCVIQRCLDHSSGPQRVRLVGQITDNAFPLVQDPFGNYVMQYILDLKDMRFIHPIIDLFKGQIAALSKHKFSSNVIEKLLRNSDGPSARAVIDEMLVGNELERMLRDSYANYVVQTAMDVADQTTRRRIIDIIRPILPSMRQTPHGRRIAGKILNADPSGRNHHGHNGMRTSPQLPKGALQRPIVFSRPSSSYGPRHALPPTPAMSSSNTPPGGSYTSTPPAGYNTTPPSGVDGGSSPEGEDAARALFGGSAAGRGDQRYSYF